MAQNGRQASRRYASVRAGAYVDGSAARAFPDEPEYTPRKNTRKSAAPQPVRDPDWIPEKNLSETAQKNRRKASEISAGYVLFLILSCGLILAVSIHYLQLQTEITNRKKEITRLESELNSLRDENDAYYSQVSSNIDLNEIRQRAIGSLGMKLPEENQIQTYETEGRSYFRQFQDIPDTK